MRSLTLPSLALVFCAVLVGCGSGGDQKQTAAVKGTVKFNGEAVTGGSLTFSPVAESGSAPGKPGSATVGEDGTFTVTTYSDGDGAVVGKHRVGYSAPAPEAPDGGGHEAAKPSPYDGLVPKEAEVTIVEGGNTLEIELVKP